MIRTNSEGDSLFAIDFEFGGGGDIRSVAMNPEGYISFCGGVNNCGFIYMYDPNGVQLWRHIYDDFVGGDQYSVVALDDGTFTSYGVLWNTGGQLLHYGVDDSVLWRTSFPYDTIYPYDWSHDKCLIRTADHGYAMCGENTFAKTDSLGRVTVAADDYTIPPIDNGISISAYPNPFNPSTTVSFTLDSPESCTVNIYNTRGQLVRQLASGRFDTGDHSVTWDGSDDHGLPQSTGVYLIRLQAGTKTMMKRVTLLK
jgi:hypothetical protein